MRQGHPAAQLAPFRQDERLNSHIRFQLMQVIDHG
jgi:hypothetical protein